ncbi:MAG TPA: response regulator [Caldimonas sp.]|jgi:DNA-binding NarL/FixJ family response regulator
MDNIKIYLIEDSSIIRENLIDALHENAPIEVVGTAEDERSALSWLNDRSHACDLAIVDIFLKSGSGLGVLKAMGDMPEAPLRIVLSNHATPEIRVKCRQLGAARVFDKSNELDEMLGWLNRYAQSDRGAAASRS